MYLTAIFISFLFQKLFSRDKVRKIGIFIIIGLVLEGGHFDGLRLSEASHDSSTFTSCPVATFAWIPKTEANYYRENEVINLPLYHTSDREKILASVDVPAAGGDENKWLKAGIVLYINVPG